MLTTFIEPGKKSADLYFKQKIMSSLHKNLIEFFRGLFHVKVFFVTFIKNESFSLKKKKNHEVRHDHDRHNLYTFSKTIGKLKGRTKRKVKEKVRTEKDKNKTQTSFPPVTLNRRSMTIK